ncbi:MAG: CDP-diacylglycerol--serine O-phosphatidyltransferase [bacterium]
MKNKLYFVPNIFTLLNLFFGFLALVKIFSGENNLAAWFIIFAVIFDAWDGVVARATNLESSFGFEFDSLADMISSGLAPALLIYTTALHSYGVWGILICFCYVFSGSYRLSRFNVLHSQTAGKGYTGLPLPVSAVVVSSLWIFSPPFVTIDVSSWWFYLIIFLSIIMVSPVPYNWPVISFKKGYKITIVSIILLLGTGIMILFPKKYLFPLLMIFILYGVVKWTVKSVFKKYVLRR